MKRFWVAGKVIGQGNISFYNGHSVHANAKDLKPWRELIGWKAREAQVPLLAGPVKLELVFVLVRPKTSKREFPYVVPDLDHYIRAVGDALKGIAFIDDSQICQILASKVYGEFPGVEITIGPLT